MKKKNKMSSKTDKPNIKMKKFQFNSTQLLNKLLSRIQKKLKALLTIFRLPMSNLLKLNRMLKIDVRKSIKMKRNYLTRNILKKLENMKKKSNKKKKK